VKELLFEKLFSVLLGLQSDVLAIKHHHMFDDRKSVHHHTIQTNQPKRCNSFTNLLLHVWLNMFRAPPPPSSGAYNCTSSLWFYCWGVAVAVLLVVV
jgi:hypothetical protein